MKRVLTISGTLLVYGSIIIAMVNLAASLSATLNGASSSFMPALLGCTSAAASGIVLRHFGK